MTPALDTDTLRYPGSDGSWLIGLAQIGNSSVLVDAIGEVFDATGSDDDSPEQPAQRGALWLALAAMALCVGAVAWGRGKRG